MGFWTSYAELSGTSYHSSANDLQAEDGLCYNNSMVWNLRQLFDDPIGTLKSLAVMLPIILISLTLHEWGHAYAAYRCGDPTAKNFGRLTLNPLAHIDLVGLISLLVFGFGWAKPVPVNPRNYRNFRRGEVAVSLAGVVMNLLLVFFGFLAFVLIGLLRPMWMLSNEMLIMAITYLVTINCTLFLFNLLPLYPLDGYHLAELALTRILPAKFFLFVRRYGRYILITMLILCNFLNISLFSWMPNLVFEGAFRLMGLFQGW